MNGGPWSLDPCDARWRTVREILPEVQGFCALLSHLLVSTPESGVRSSSDLNDYRLSPGLPHSPATDPRFVAFDPTWTELQRLADIFEEYEVVKGKLTPKQWQAVVLRFRSGLSEAEIASRLGTNRSAVHGLLQRARERKDRWQRQLRKEAVVGMRNNANS